MCVCGEGRGMELLEGSIFWVVKLSKGLKIYGISFSGFQIFLRVILFEDFWGRGAKDIENQFVLGSIFLC